ncbi:dihydropteroate synthase [Candidatus Liberibacter americanus]|uniref:Dihydropteroate synthase n=1 Tax=Candidatus Liberibacter americanus str. Sao Paulo TaxID=1261131 RepID=U6B4W8_9HYPH|nr:dihydropteroate synthase [Candidatus Liberibacter americanus]AHA27940.1 Dihydropteroate synthase [Candidatus Liberibacter americanus str. Sao Paulo]EMS35837.1 dihydropteroate synthase [Candidatus Liberibacter americanus PW_SP]
MEKDFYRIWKTAHNRSINIDYKPLIMAIINVTPNSFSDGGDYLIAEKAISHSINCLEEGADIIDIGGESTNPNAVPISAKEEQARIIPVIEELSNITDAIISVDTYRSETAKLAIRAGAHIINDVFGLQHDKNMAATIAKYGAGVCIMHTGRNRTKLCEVFEDQFYFLKKSLEIAFREGINRDCIVLDPGFGFSKNTKENLSIIADFSKFNQLDFPILVGVSRKRFLGKITGRNRSLDRDCSTAVANCLLRVAGANIFRVHNVKINIDALRLTDAVIQSKSIYTHDSLGDKE